MTLSRKIIYKNLILLLWLLLLGMATIWGLLGLRRNIRIATHECSELRDIEAISVRVAAARGMLASTSPSEPDVRMILRDASAGLSDFIRSQGRDLEGTPEAGDVAHNNREIDLARHAAEKIRLVQGALDSMRVAASAGAPEATTDLERTRAIVAPLDSALMDLGRIVQEGTALTNEAQNGASEGLRATLELTAVMSACALLTAAVISLGQYRAIMIPLRRLHLGVRMLARADFSDRLEASGDLEFVELTEDFNRMAAELRDFYLRLEQKVGEKSRQLVRSERLASVGFLAAGVAHEINNPLGIIAGYAELSLKQGPRGDADASAADRQQGWLRVIRDEAFRCKQITQKLLSLSRGGDDVREPVELARAAEEVGTMIGGLPKYQGRRLVVRTAATPPGRPGRDPSGSRLRGAPARGSDGQLWVDANLAEMKQVLLNLTLNALDAVPADGGEVRIEGGFVEVGEGSADAHVPVGHGSRRDADAVDRWVEIAVIDNGRGMTPDVLERIFEPFYTDKRGAGEPGTGLGLSITHAIVERHGGYIRAESAGPGRGSRFTIRFPSIDAPAVRAPRSEVAARSVDLAFFAGGGTAGVRGPAVAADVATIKAGVALAADPASATIAPVAP